MICSTGAITLAQSLITLVGMWSGPGAFVGSSLSNNNWIPWVEKSRSCICSAYTIHVQCHHTILIRTYMQKQSTINLMSLYTYITGSK